MFFCSVAEQNLEKWRAEQILVYPLLYEGERSDGEAEVQRPIA